MQLLPGRFSQGEVVFVTDHEGVFGAFAECRNARIMHAQALVAQHERHIGQQAGTVRGDQGKTGCARFIAEFDARRKTEMTQLPRHHPA